MSSILGVGALATVIAVPIALTSGSTTVVTPSISEKEKAAIDAFNKKEISQKIDLYNSIMANSSNNTAIKNYIHKGNDGINNAMSTFVRLNVKIPTDSAITAIFNGIKTELQKPNFLTIANMNGEFLNIRGVLQSSNNFNDTSRYLQQAMTLNNNNGGVFSFYSPIKTKIVNVEMLDNFSIKMTLPNDQSNVAFSFKDQYGQDKLFYYKQEIIFSESMLFPGMSEFVKKNILEI
ncbi:MAG: hypothetical protein RSE21_05655 [Bacilli bacterium]